MSIGPPIPEIQHFLNLTVKIQRQGHSSRSQSRYNTLSTHIPFVPCRSTLPFLGYSNFKIWHWKFKVQVMGEVKVESHNMGPTFSRLTSLSFHVNQQCSKLLPVHQPEAENFGGGQGTFLKLFINFVFMIGDSRQQDWQLLRLSFEHCNQASHSWVMNFSKFDLENQGSRSWVRS